MSDFRLFSDMTPYEQIACAKSVTGLDIQDAWTVEPGGALWARYIEVDPYQSRYVRINGGNGVTAWELILPELVAHVVPMPP